MKNKVGFRVAAELLDFMVIKFCQVSM